MSATLWTAACQTPLSMGFSRQEYWSGLPYLPPGDLSNSGIQVTFLMSPVLAGVFSPTSTTWEAWESKIMVIKTSFDFPSEEGKATCWQRRKCYGVEKPRKTAKSWNITVEKGQSYSGVNAWFCQSLLVVIVSKGQEWVGNANNPAGLKLSMMGRP